ncbi:hypothetical protein [Cobetia marina]|uniref:hypothetical protein n=1 Tax=Cobetia marina TaxID=28258 RepID=UPI00174B47F7
MANQSDIQLRIQAAVDGLQDIGKLMSELDNLGQDSSEASAEVERLSEEMSAIGQQQKLVTQINKVAAVVDDAGTAMREAVDKADGLQAAYENSANGADSLRLATQRAAQEADDAKAAHVAQTQTLTQLQTSYKGAQTATTAARQAWRDAAQRVRDLKSEIGRSANATDEQRQALSRASGAVEQAKDAYDAQAQSLSSLRDELQQQREATDEAKEEWQSASASAAQLTAELKPVERELKQQEKALNKARAAADKATAGHEAQAQKLTRLQQDAHAAGVDIDNLADEEQRLTRQSRELEDDVTSLASGLRETAAAARESGEAAERSESRFKKAGASLKQWAAGAAAATVAGAGLAVGWATRYTAQQAEMAQQLDITSRSLGISTQALQGYQYAFQRAGIDADKTGNIFKDTADKIGDAYQNGGGEAQDALDALGIKAEELIELAPDEMMLRLADAMKDLPQAAQVNLLESLADDATRLQPLLANNAAELRALMEEASEVGLIMSPEQIANLQATDAAITRLQGRLQGLSNRLMGELSSAVNQVSADFEKALAENPGLLDDLATAIGGVIRTGGEWARSFLEHRDQIGGAMQSVVDTGQFMGNSLLAVFRLVQSAAAGLTAGIASVSTGVLQLNAKSLELLNKVGAATDEEVARAQAKAKAAEQTLYDLNKDAARYFKQAAEAGKDAANAFDNSDTAAQKAAKSATKQAAASEAAAIAAKKQAEEEEKGAKQVADAAAKRQKALENAATSLGTSLGELSSGIADSEQEALDAFATLAASGELSAAQLATAFEKAQDKIKSDKGIAALKDQVDGLVNDGVSGADSLATKWKSAGARLAKDMGTTLEEIRTGVTEAERSAIDAFTKIASTGELSAKELSRAYVGAKEQISSKEGIKAFGAVLDGLVKDGVTGARTLKAQWIEAQEATAKAARDTGDKAQQASADTAKTVEASVTRSAQTIAQLMSNALHETEEQMRSLSGAAYQAFATDWGIDTQAEGIEGMQDRIAELDHEIGDLRDNLATRLDSTGFTAWMTDLATTSRQTEIAFLEQKIAVESLTDQIEAGRAPASALSQDMDDLSSRFDLLDESDLSGLESAIQSVRSQVESLSDSVSDTLASLRSELASLQGDSAQVEALRYQQQQTELQEALNAARALGDAQTISAAQESLRLAERAHDLRLEDIRAQSEQEKQQALADEAERQRNVQEAEATQRENNRDAQNRTSQLTQSVQAQRRVAVDLNIAGQQVTLNGVDESEADAFLDRLTQASRTTARR